MKTKDNIKLTELVKEYNATPGGQIASCVISMGLGAIDAIKGTSKDCCYDSDKKWKKWVIKAADQKIHWMVTRVVISLPTWTERTSNCASAQNEWNQWYKVVKGHEDGHRLNATNFITQEKISGYFTRASLDFESDCVEESKSDAKKSELESKFLIAVNSASQKIGADYDADDNKYHNIAPYRDPDGSKECK